MFDSVLYVSAHDHFLSQTKIRVHNDEQLQRDVVASAFDVLCSIVHTVGLVHTVPLTTLHVSILPRQLLGGALQSTGWPGVVAVMSNWFGKGK